MGKWVGDEGRGEEERLHSNAERVSISNSLL